MYSLTRGVRMILVTFTIDQPDNTVLVLQLNGLPFHTDIDGSFQEDLELADRHDLHFFFSGDPHDTFKVEASFRIDDDGPLKTFKVLERSLGDTGRNIRNTRFFKLTEAL